MTGVPGGDDDVVQIQQGNKPGDPFVITVNCPDKTGLACDICRIILDFGLCIVKGDASTDGVWCYIVLWVIPHSILLPMSCLKERLQAICPPCLASFYLVQKPMTSSPVYLLKFCCLNRKGLLHDVTKVLCELELTIQKVKVTTTPDGSVLDLFFITDNMELLHTRKRQDETRERLDVVLQDSCISCELQLAGPEYEYNQGMSSLSPVLAEELFRCELSDNEVRSQALSPDMTKLKKTNILYGRFSPNAKGYRDLDIFIQQKDGKKILDSGKQSALCSRLKLEMLHPLRVIIANRGPDTELLVANPVELSGKGRPRVFYDVTYALKTLGICVFSAEVGRYSASEREWEVYRFLLDENCEFQLTGVVARNQIVDRVRRTLMGW
ncbi:ACT domain [Sesbania bispinosa]|nr:ACT domain [Sesbania bispinosa]